MNKNNLIIFIAGVAIGAMLCFYILPFVHRSSVVLNNSELSGEVVLVQKNSNGMRNETGLRIPYDITGAYSGVYRVVFSSSKKQVLYTAWEDTKVKIYVSDLYGSHVRKIAEQEVGEGSGELIVNSIEWSQDEKRVTYTETSSHCEADCLPEDIKLIQTKYIVDVESGEKKVVESK